MAFVDAALVQGLTDHLKALDAYREPGIPSSSSAAHGNVLGQARAGLASRTMSPRSLMVRLVKYGKPQRSEARSGAQPVSTRRFSSW